jgi:hypothetical protein
LKSKEGALREYFGAPISRTSIYFTIFSVFKDIGCKCSGDEKPSSFFHPPSSSIDHQEDGDGEGEKTK